MRGTKEKCENCMNKKSQITLFIILGILILLGISIAIYVYTQERSPIQVENTETVTARREFISDYWRGASQTAKNSIKEIPGIPKLSDGNINLGKVTNEQLKQMTDIIKTTD